MIFSAHFFQARLTQSKVTFSNICNVDKFEAIDLSFLTAGNNRFSEKKYLLATASERRLFGPDEYYLNKG